MQHSECIGLLFTCLLHMPLLLLDVPCPGSIGHKYSVWMHCAAHRSEGVAFLLNTRDFSAAIEDEQRKIPCAVDASVPDEVLDRCCAAYEPRRDVQGGQLVSIRRAPRCAHSLVHVGAHSVVKALWRAQSVVHFARSAVHRVGGSASIWAGVAQLIRLQGPCAFFSRYCPKPGPMTCSKVT
jgi:hypothetical protein